MIEMFKIENLVNVGIPTLIGINVFLVLLLFVKLKKGDEK